jgi:N-acetylglucosamine malate deacetylase 1
MQRRPLWFALLPAFVLGLVTGIAWQSGSLTPAATASSTKNEEPRTENQELPLPPPATKNEEPGTKNEELLAQATTPQPATRRADDGKLNIICFGAHPDDAELRAAGVGAMWAAQGHHVKLVSVTNGDIGHWRDGAGPLARRRAAEVHKAAELLGITTEVLDIHDGELMPTLENRRTITRLIREWNADIVMSHRPNDYHPDHRYVGVLVQDAAFMVQVPFFCPDTPPLKNNPVFLFYPDRFQKPYPFKADIAVSIDGVIEKKLDALDLLVSQFYEGGALGNESLIPTDPARQEDRKRQVRTGMANRNRGVATQYRETLAEYYGKDAAEKIVYAEAFEICEYGRQPNKDEIRRLFPFFPK